MHIIYATYQFFPDSRSNTYQSINTIKQFKKRNIDSVLLYPERKHSQEDIKSHYDLDFSPTYEALPHTKFFKYQFGFLNRFIYIFLHLRFGFRLKKYVRKYKRDNTIIYTRSPIILYCLRSLDIPFVYESHQYTRLTKTLITSFWSKNKKLLVITTTPHLQDYFIDLDIPENNVVYLESSYNEEYFINQEQQKASSRQKVITFGGSLKIMDESKDVEKIIEAFSELIKNDDSLDAVFHIYTANEREFNYLNNFVSNSSFGDEIVVSPRISQEQYINKLYNSDIGIVALPDTYHVNNFSSSLKYFEYIRAGLVILASDVKANSRFPYPNTVFYNPNMSNIQTALEDALKLSENKIDYDVKNITQYSHQNRISSILDKMYSLDFIARPEGLEPSTP